MVGGRAKMADERRGAKMCDPELGWGATSKDSKGVEVGKTLGMTERGAEDAII